MIMKIKKARLFFRFYNRSHRTYSILLPIILLISALIILSTTGKAENQNDEVQLKPGKREKTITTAVAGLLERYHYTRRKLNNDLSKVLFKEYFDRLDPNHSYFLASDIKDFEEYRFLLDDMLRQGDLTFTYAIYQRFLKRFQNRLDHVKKRIQQPFDFSKEEMILSDRSEAAWPQNMQEMDELWRKQIKNQLLLEILQNEMQNKQKVSDSKENALDKETDQQATPEEAVLQYYQQQFRVLKDNDNSDILEFYLSTLSRIYDPHSNYLNWRAWEDFQITMKLSLQGIGATLRSENGYTRIVSVTPGGPAKRDGRLKSGHRIVAVKQEKGNWENVINMPLGKVVRKIRGPKGTKVYLKVIQSLQSIPQVIDLTRDLVHLEDRKATGEIIEIPSSDGKKHPYGVITLPSFYVDYKKKLSASSDVKRIINDMLKKHQIKGLIMDLRRNGGGDLSEAIKLTGLFIPQGPIVQVKNLQGIRSHKDKDGGFAYDMPLAVLVTQMSASASEIFAGAIQDYGRGIIIGNAQTHGKGTVQITYNLKKLAPLRNSKVGSLKLTIAKFYRITGTSTQQKGVIPDVIIPSYLDHRKELLELHLPHVLKWDEIPAQNFEKSKKNVHSYLKTLKEKSNKRLQNNTTFLKLQEELNRYRNFLKRKTVTLNKKQRTTLWKDEEYWTEHLNKIFTRDNKEVISIDNRSDDIYLQEAIHVLKDLISLHHKQN